jgi:hypothetical protein
VADWLCCRSVALAEIEPRVAAMIAIMTKVRATIIYLAALGAFQISAAGEKENPGVKPGLQVSTFRHALMTRFIVHLSRGAVPVCVLNLCKADLRRFEINNGDEQRESGDISKDQHEFISHQRFPEMELDE